MKTKKPSRKKPSTPRSKVRAALTMLFLRSRERAAAVKRDQNTCQICKAKGSKAKGREVATVVHHINGAHKDEIINLIYEKLLCDPNFLLTLCNKCHVELHIMGNN
jgi:hypothetical protein